MMRRLFADAGAQQRTAIDGLEASLRNRYAAGQPPDVVRRSIIFGRLVGAAVFAWSRTDGGHEGSMFNFPVQYDPPSGPGLWAPTPPGYQRAMQPYWGENRPFLLTDGAECQPPPPPAYDTQPASAMYADALAVYGAVRNLTPEQREIALFWADDPTLTATPPGHSWAIATQVLRDEKATLAQAAETYARLGIAVADAFVGCWNTKFVYNRIRPLTYIQQVIDPTWNTPSVLDPVQTPPFPEYPSGHSTEAAAAAEVLRALFGADYGFIDRTQARLGFAPRFFPSFRAAAEEAAISRLYGGIHFPTGNDAGLVQGACVGQRVVDLAFYR
jgi:membrane-associated phospholipid phosphatase